MRTLSMLAAAILIAGCASAAPKTEFEKDVVPTSKGDLQITFIGHGTLMFQFDDKVIHTGTTDTAKLVQLLKDVEGIEVRIRSME